jgi:hypothetical protein
MNFITIQKGFGYNEFYNNTEGFWLQQRTIIYIFFFFFFYRLAVIYTGAMADIKRTILRTLETPVS